MKRFRSCGIHFVQTWRKSNPEVSIFQKFSLLLSLHKLCFSRVGFHPMSCLSVHKIIYFYTCSFYTWALRVRFAFSKTSQRTSFIVTADSIYSSWLPGFVNHEDITHTLLRPPAQRLALFSFTVLLI